MYGLVLVYGLYGLYILFGYIKQGEMSAKWKNFWRIAIATVVSIGIAGILCFVSIKIGYKTGAINYIAIEQPEKEKPIGKEEETKPTEYNSAFDNVLKTLKQMTVDKLISNSGQERMNGEKVGFSLYKYSPIVGIGLGSYRTFSLFTNILINTGIIGILSFIGILYIVIKPLIKARKENEVVSVMLLISIIAGTLTFFTGVPDFVFMYYWIILVLGYKYATLEK